MKKDLHAKDYRLVVFKDLNTGAMILTRSTVRTEETVKYTDGKEYPLVNVHISSDSHPFYTGQEKLLDMEGRVDRFKARKEAAAKAHAAKLERAKKAASKPAKVKADEKLQEPKETLAEPKAKEAKKITKVESKTPNTKE